MNHLSLIYPMSKNIGDDIQTLAATQYLTNPVYIDRDNLKNSKEKGKLILNGWWTHSENAWPPPPEIECLPISMHLTLKYRPLFQKHKSWFDGKKVLARDQSTNEFLQSIGVDSEFGGCLTLTLPRNEPEERTGVYLVDVPQIHERGIRVEHKIDRPLDHEYRRLKAKQLLAVYQHAELVITSRLHCALPCAAMGTPVVCVANGIRYSGMEKFIVMSDGKNLKKDIEKAKNFDRSEIEKHAEILRKIVIEFL